MGGKSPKIPGPPAPVPMPDAGDTLLGLGKKRAQASMLASGRASTLLSDGNSSDKLG